MSMSTHVIAFRPPDQKWLEMKAIFDACIKAKISIPKEVNDFFNGEDPDSSGVSVDIENLLREWTDDESMWGYELDITKLPSDIKILRFFNSN